MRPTWVEINLDSIRQNLKKVKSLIADDVSVLAIVKADAYGHGVLPVSETLIREGVDSLGVATLEEAMELREGGIKGEIVILGSLHEEEVELILDYELTPTVYDKDVLDHLTSNLEKLDKRLDFHLKVDTGMSRLGIKAEELGSFLGDLKTKSCLRLKGIFTHLASADESENSHTKTQISSFNESLDTLNTHNIQPEYIHLANSAAIQNFPESHGNLVRPGIMIYGAGEQNGNKLMPVMRLKSKIIQLKMHDKGTPVSYGGTYVTDKRSLIATVPIGYADGYLRKLSNKAYVSVRGQKARVVGAVCMDFIMIDVTDIQDVGLGEEVTLFGDDVVTISDISGWAETIPYEIMTLVGKRVHRVFL